MPFTVAMPALSLLLVFRTNTGYARWNEARTLWGGVVNTCRNVVRQSNTFYPRTLEGDMLRDRQKANSRRDTVEYRRDGQDAAEMRPRDICSDIPMCTPVYTGQHRRLLQGAAQLPARPDGRRRVPERAAGNGRGGPHPATAGGRLHGREESADVLPLRHVAQHPPGDAGRLSARPPLG